MIVEENGKEYWFADAPEYPKQYYDVSMEYACSTKDLFNAVPNAPTAIIRTAAKMLGQGMLWWQVAATFKGNYEVD